MSSRKKLWIVGLVIASYGAASVLLGDFPHSILVRSLQLPAMQAELENHRSRWQAANVNHYKSQVDNLGFTSYAAICSSAELEVNKGQLVDLAGAGVDAQWCPAVYSQLTIDGLFEIASNYIRRNDPWRVTQIQIDYEPTYGYIKNLRVHVQATMWDSLILGENYLTAIDPTSFQITVELFQVLNQ